MLHAGQGPDGQGANGSMKELLERLSSMDRLNAIPLKLSPRKVKFLRQIVPVAVKSGTHEVDALVAGTWAVHKSLNGKGWSVTHIATGLLLVGGLKSKKDAKEFLIGMVAEVPALFNESDKNKIGKYEKLFRDLVKNRRAKNDNAQYYR